MCLLTVNVQPVINMPRCKIKVPLQATYALQTCYPCREGELLLHRAAAFTRRNDTTVIRVGKNGTEDNKTSRSSGSHNMMSPRDKKQTFRIMAVVSL